MLIVSNGAFKSGSTWLYNILRELTGYPPPPPEYLNPEWRNPSLADDRIGALLMSLKPDDCYLVKNHFNQRGQRDQLLAHPAVRVLNITRDLRDVTVSSYYHACRVDGFSGDFASYYWSEGRISATKVARYHVLWRPSAQVFAASYERLHADFAAQVREIAGFLGMPVTDAQIERIHEVTSLDALRERYGEADTDQQFFRKGVIGDWQAHFTPEIAADLDAFVRKIKRESSLSNRIIRRVKRLVKVRS